METQNSTAILTAATVLNLASLIGTVVLGFICIFMLSFLLRSIAHNHDIVLILVANNYLGLFTFTLSSMSNNIDIVRGDFHLSIGEETVYCRIKGYIMYSCTAVVFYTFALQAIFCYTSVVYSSHAWLQNPYMYIVIIPIQWIISFIVLLPVFIWHDIQFIPPENTCLLSIDNMRGVIWCMLVMYILPMNIVCIVYFQLTRFIRRSSMIVSVRVKRNITVVRRIVIVVCALGMIGGPTIILTLIVTLLNNGKHMLYRISNISVVVSMHFLSFMLIYVTPQVQQTLTSIG